MYGLLLAGIVGGGLKKCGYDDGLGVLSRSGSWLEVDVVATTAGVVWRVKRPRWMCVIVGERRASGFPGACDTVRRTFSPGNVGQAISYCVDGQSVGEAS